MKDPIRFAKLISFLTAIKIDSNDGFSQYEIEQVAGYIADFVAMAAQPQKIDLNSLFTAMGQGRKIDAIKEYRAFTGEGLKESKDAIEIIMNKFERNASLGDILKTATGQ